MELHQLRYFVAVADCGNFTRAAEACHVAQPSLSQQIIKLETELGHPLLERLNRRVRLTAVGRSFYERAVRILAEIEQAGAEARGDAVHAGGTLRVGAILTVAPYVLPKLAQRFTARQPAAELILREDVTERLVADCIAGELDLILTAEPLDHEHLHVEPWFEDELLLATPANHPLAKRRRVSMADVINEPFILLDPIHCLGDQIISFCHDRNYRPAVRCSSSQLLTVQQMVAAGQGVSLVPKLAARVDRSRRCHYRSLTAPAPKRHLVIARHRHRYFSPLAESFVQIAHGLHRTR